MNISLYWFIEGIHKSINNDAIIVIDATRFSSTVITALACGIEKIIPLDNPEKYLEYVDDRSKFILAFEDDEAKKIPYADIGNSPKELLKIMSTDKFRQVKTMIIRSRAGSQLLYTAKTLGLKNVLIGSFPNARALAAYIFKRGFNGVGIVCSGYRRSNFALDDYLAAGSIVYEILKCDPKVVLDEQLFGAYLAYVGANKLGIPIGEIILNRANVGNDLKNINCIDDVDIISQSNVHDIVPILVGDFIVDALKSCIKG
ncbi:MAG: 2-phosphosulfolactate phosphatase [Nitrososphaeria archaeon]